jgi:hypothetical protein
MNMLRAAVLLGVLFGAPLQVSGATASLGQALETMTAAMIFGAAPAPGQVRGSSAAEVQVALGRSVAPCPPTPGDDTEQPCQIVSRDLPGGCGELVLARVVAEDRVTTRATVRIPTECESQTARFARSLRPVEVPLSQFLPRDAVAVWDAGTTPAALAGLADELLGELAPRHHAWVADLLAEARAVGVDPVADLLPALGEGLAEGVLAPERGPSRWPLPRPVWLVRVKDRRAATRAMDELLHWEAGAFAEASGGVVSATLIHEEVLGATVSYLDVDSVVDVPLPSPAIAFIDGLLVISPVRSAVEDTLGAIQLHGRAEQTPEIPVPPGAAARLQASPAAIACGLELASSRLGRLAALLGYPLAGSDIDSASGLLRELLSRARPWRQANALAWVVEGEDGVVLVVDGELVRGGRHPGPER